MMTPPSSRDRRVAAGAGAAALALLLGALGFQYLGHLPPCEMCHWQRWAHIAAALIGLALVLLWKQNTHSLAILTLALVAASGLIGAYQAGMQWGLLPGPQTCTAARYVLGSGAPPPQISCNVVTWSFLGLSLAVYNAIFSLAVAVLGAFMLKDKRP